MSEDSQPKAAFERSGKLPGPVEKPVTGKPMPWVAPPPAPSKPTGWAS